MDEVYDEEVACGEEVAYGVTDDKSAEEGGTGDDDEAGVYGSCGCDFRVHGEYDFRGRGAEAMYDSHVRGAAEERCGSRGYDSLVRVRDVVEMETWASASHLFQSPFLRCRRMRSGSGLFCEKQTPTLIQRSHLLHGTAFSSSQFLPGAVRQ